MFARTFFSFLLTMKKNTWLKSSSVTRPKFFPYIHFFKNLSSFKIIFWFLQLTYTKHCHKHFSQYAWHLDNCLTSSSPNKEGKKNILLFLHYFALTTLTTFFPRALLLVSIGSNGFPNVTLKPLTCSNMSNLDRCFGAYLSSFVLLK